jgi:hypothetical protein
MSYWSDPNMVFVYGAIIVFLLIAFLKACVV